MRKITTTISSTLSISGLPKVWIEYCFRKNWCLPPTPQVCGLGIICQWYAQTGFVFISHGKCHQCLNSRLEKAQIYFVTCTHPDIHWENALCQLSSPPLSVWEGGRHNHSNSRLKLKLFDLFKNYQCVKQPAITNKNSLCFMYSSVCKPGTSYHAKAPNINSGRNHFH